MPQSREEYLRQSLIPPVQSLTLSEGLLPLLPGVRFVLQGAPDAAAEAEAAARIRQYWHCDGCVTREVAAAPALPPEGYRLEITPEQCRIQADTPAALRHAFATLRQLSEPERGVLKASHRTLPCVRVEDAPALSFRGLHLCWFPESSPTNLEKWIRLAGYLKYNYLILESWGVFPFPSHPEFGWPEKKVSIAQVQHLLQVARDAGLTVIPQCNTFGHGALCRTCSGKHALLNHHPEYASLYEPDGWTWCLSNPATRQYLTDLCEDLYEAFGAPPFFHIGFDEAYNAGSCSRCAQADYRSLCRDHILYFHDYFRKRGTRILLWHDMLLNSADPRWQGYVRSGDADFEALGLTLPRDILICDWQYWRVRDAEGKMREEWPTSAYFHEAGFDTLSCGWTDYDLSVSLGHAAAQRGQFGYLQTIWNSEFTHTVNSFAGGAAAGWNPAAARQPIGLRREECFTRYLRDITLDMGLRGYTDVGFRTLQTSPYDLDFPG